jgi:hypothetical protein
MISRLPQLLDKRHLASMQGTFQLTARKPIDLQQDHARSIGRGIDQFQAEQTDRPFPAAHPAAQQAEERDRPSQQTQSKRRPQTCVVRMIHKVPGIKRTPRRRVVFREIEAPVSACDQSTGTRRDWQLSDTAFENLWGTLETVGWMIDNSPLDAGIGVRAEGVGSRFRATVNHMVSDVAENDSRPRHASFNAQP